MFRKPGNMALLFLAVLLLLDIIIQRPALEGGFLVSMGVLGALLSRAGLTDPQSIVLVLLGIALTIIAVSQNHGIIAAGSDTWFVLTFFLALTYALWEKILSWFFD